MQVITRIPPGIQLARDLRVRQHLIQINNSVKHTRGANERVDLLPRLLPLRITVRLPGEVGRRGKRRDGRSKHRDTMGVDQCRHLAVCLRQRVVHGCLGCGRGGRAANVVDAFENHGVADARVGEHVTVDAAECVRAQTITQDAVTTSCEVAKGDVRGLGRLLKAGEKAVGPAVVLVGCRATAVGDGVANDEEGAQASTLEMKYQWATDWVEGSVMARAEAVVASPRWKKLVVRLPG
jgi:hypothetical protein